MDSWKTLEKSLEWKESIGFMNSLMHQYNTFDRIHLRVSGRTRRKMQNIRWENYLRILEIFQHDFRSKCLGIFSSASLEEYLGTIFWMSWKIRELFVKEMLVESISSNSWENCTRSLYTKAKFKLSVNKVNYVFWTGLGYVWKRRSINCIKYKYFITYCYLYA